MGRTEELLKELYDDEFNDYMPETEHEQIVYGLKDFAVYPKECGVAYPTLGLVDEISEAIAWYSRGQGEYLYDELGDVLWYLNETAYQYGRLLNIPGFALSEICEGASSDALGALFVDEALDYALKAAAEIAGISKKVIRDGRESLNENKVEMVLHNLRWIAGYIYYIADVFECDKVALATQVHDKLTDRRNRNVLHGDGDKR